MRALLSSLKNARALAVGGEFVYVAVDDSILRVPKAGGAPVILSNAEAEPSVIAVTNRWILWGNRGRGDAGTAGEIVKFPR
jgi:hypothetical protein